MRRLRTKPARAALARARDAAHRAGIAGLAAEVESTAKLLATPAARLIARGQQRPLLLDEVEALMASKALVVDACRYVVRDSRTTVSLTRRPVLFALARALGEAWPQDASRGTLIARAFRGKHADESHRARLRVEIGRLRRALLPLADLNATPDGFVLAPRGRREVSVLALPRIASQDAYSRLTPMTKLNEVTQLPLADPSHSPMPLMDPAFAVAICRYDLSTGPLKLTVPVSQAYTSVSFYTRNEVAYYAINDRSAGKKVIELDLDARDQASAQAQIKAMCERLLANPVIETYRISLAE